ncbi:MAG: hypothetical protein ACR2N1_07115, partial [Rubripirellula sp.]
GSRISFLVSLLTAVAANSLKTQTAFLTRTAREICFGLNVGVAGHALRCKVPPALQGREWAAWWWCGGVKELRFFKGEVLSLLFQ